MNIYDTANNLAKELKSSDEYVTLKKLKDEISNNLEVKEKLQDFEKIRYEAQISSIKGEEQNKEKIEQFQNLYIELMQNETVKQYFEAEVRFSTILQDVNRIIAEAVKDIIGI